MLRIITEDQVPHLCDFASAWDAVEHAYRATGTSDEVQSRPSVMTIPGPRPILGRPELGQYRLKGASVAVQHTAGAFLYTREHPYMYLWDTDNDAPIGLVACDWLSQYRVAITVVYGIKLLGKPDVRKIAFFGAGRYSTEPCRLVAERFPEAQVHLLASCLANAEAFATNMPPNVIPCGDPRVAIEDADVVVTMTNAKAPIVGAGMLAPGALVLSMGSAHEVEIAVLDEVGPLFVDDLDYAVAQGDLAAWIRRGEISAEAAQARISAGIGEVVAGLKPGRETPEERIVAIVQGLTACDVAVAKAVLDRATEQRVGQTATL